MVFFHPGRLPDILVDIHRVAAIIFTVFKVVGVNHRINIIKLIDEQVCSVAGQCMIPGGSKVDAVAGRGAIKVVSPDHSVVAANP